MNYQTHSSAARRKYNLAEMLGTGLVDGVIIGPHDSIVDCSFKGKDELFGTSPSWIIDQIYLGGYSWIINAGGILQPLKNSLITSGVTMTMFFALTSGYAVAKFKFHGKALFMVLLFACQV